MSFLKRSLADANGDNITSYAISHAREGVDEPRNKNYTGIVTGTECTKIAYQIVLSNAPGFIASSSEDPRSSMGAPRTWDFRVVFDSAQTYGTPKYGFGGNETTRLCTISGDAKSCSGVADVYYEASDLVSFSADMSSIGKANDTLASWSVRCIESNHLKWSGSTWIH